MRNTVLFILTCLFFQMNSFAQSHSDFETIKSDQEAEVIYKGSCTFEDIGKVSAFDLEKNAAAYTPAAAKIDALKNSLGNYHLVIVMGTWCEDSHYMIPKLYRVLKEVQYPIAAIDLFAVDREKKGRNGEEQKYGITNVPTVILLKDGVEKGRITETVQKSIEEDMLNIIEKN
jgi:thiol-disulfide isomerase/thioredoxin